MVTPAPEFEWNKAISMEMVSRNESIGDGLYFVRYGGVLYAVMATSAENAAQEIWWVNGMPEGLRYIGGFLTSSRYRAW